jgi:hypothetical protein
MILGVVVAMIIAFTLWMRRPAPLEATRPGNLSVPEMPVPPSPSSLIKIGTVMFSKIYQN